MCEGTNFETGEKTTYPCNGSKDNPQAKMTFEFWIVGSIIGLLGTIPSMFGFGLLIV